MSLYLRVLFALGGAAAVYFLVHKIGADKLAATLTAALAWMPLVLAVEMFRISLDAFATYSALGDERRRVPKGLILRAQLVGTGVSSLLPGGRTSEEAAKAALLSPWAGSAAAVAAAATNQAATLLAGGIISLPCAWAAWKILGIKSVLTMLLIAHGVALTLLGSLIRLAMVSQKFQVWLIARFPRLAEPVEDFREAARQTGGVLPWRPLAALVVARFALVGEYALLARAVGADINTLQAFLMEGLNLAALAAGTLVPAQLGVSESMFVLAAAPLGMTRAQAMSIALLTHAIQVVLIVVGTLTPMLWRAPLPEDVDRDGAMPLEGRAYG